MNIRCNKYASLVISGFARNEIFDRDHNGNRDDCYYPYWLLREKFKNYGIELNTKDMNRDHPIAFELHMDVKQTLTSAPRYVLLWETEQVYPSNRSYDFLKSYKRVFTWDEALVNDQQIIKLNIPNGPMKISNIGFQGRENLCCLIAGNKSVRRKHSNELYSKRVETIRWFESHAKDDFDLYGIGWNCPPAQPGLYDRVKRKIINPFYRLLNLQPFSSYRGSVKNKNETLSHYKFAICYENVSGLPGYITEKIFDCFFAGCVPIYWGAANVEKYIPIECFIDRRKFVDHESLYTFLTEITEESYVIYQQSIKKFLASEDAKQFYAEHFSATVVASILDDLERVA